MKSKEIRSKKIEELRAMLSEKRREMENTRFSIFSSQIKEHRNYRNLKKEVARILTIINESK